MNYAITEKGDTRVISPAVTSALLALLLLGQFSLALASVGSIFTVEPGYSLLESAESEKERPELVVPDFLPTSGYEPTFDTGKGIQFYFASSGYGVHASSANIRAPPRLS